MLRTALLAFAATFLFGFSSWQWDDVAWQAQFAGAVSWSMYNVIDDNGVTDNTAALNAIPGNVPIIADCPRGGFVQFNGTWTWPSGLTVWQKPGCVLKSTIITPGVYPISMVGGTIATAPLTNIQYYGWQFSFVTPTSTVRAILLWVDHFKFKYFDLNGSGGLMFLRGSDQEIAFGTMENTIPLFGNPGIRHFGNIPLAATSPGMHANVWFHNLNFQTGDASFQSCQPANNPVTWLYNTSTDGLLYENSYGYSGDSAVILVNEPQTNDGPDYYCRNITYRNISGKGLWYGSVGNSANLTENVLVTGGLFDSALSGSNLPAFGVGAIPYGGIAAATANTNNIVVENITVNNVFQVGASIKKAQGVTLSGVTITTPRVGLTSTAATLTIDGSSGAVVKNSTIAAGNNAAAIWDGQTLSSTETTILNTTVSGVTDTKFGVRLGASTGASVNGVTSTPKLGATTATGIGLTTDPSGTHGAIVTGNNVSAMPIGVVCAPNQSNVVAGNIGASDCAP